MRYVANYSRPVPIYISVKQGIQMHAAQVGLCWLWTLARLLTESAALICLALFSSMEFHMTCNKL